MLKHELELEEPIELTGVLIELCVPPPEVDSGRSGEFRLRFVKGLLGGGYSEDALIGENGPW